MDIKDLIFNADTLVSHWTDDSLSPDEEKALKWAKILSGIPSGASANSLDSRSVVRLQGSLSVVRKIFSQEITKTLESPSELVDLFRLALKDKEISVKLEDIYSRLIKFAAEKKLSRENIDTIVQECEPFDQFQYFFEEDGYAEARINRCRLASASEGLSFVLEVPQEIAKTLEEVPKNFGSILKKYLEKGDMPDLSGWSEDELRITFSFFETYLFPSDIRYHCMEALIDKWGSEIPEDYILPFELTSLIKSRNDLEAVIKVFNKNLEEVVKVFNKNPGRKGEFLILLSQIHKANPKVSLESGATLIDWTPQSQLGELVEKIGKESYWTLNRAAKLLEAYDNRKGLPLSFIAIQSSRNFNHLANQTKMGELMELLPGDFPPSSLGLFIDLDDALIHLKVLKKGEPSSSSPEEVAAHFHLQMAEPKELDMSFTKLIDFAREKRLSREAIERIVKVCGDSDRYHLLLDGVKINRLQLASICNSRRLELDKEWLPAGYAQMIQNYIKGELPSLKNKTETNLIEGFEIFNTYSFPSDIRDHFLSAWIDLVGQEVVAAHYDNPPFALQVVALAKTPDTLKWVQGLACFLEDLNKEAKWSPAEIMEMITTVNTFETKLVYPKDLERFKTYISIRLATTSDVLLSHIFFNNDCKCLLDWTPNNQLSGLREEIQSVNNGYKATTYIHTAIPLFTLGFPDGPVSTINFPISRFVFRFVKSASEKKQDEGDWPDLREAGLADLRALNQFAFPELLPILFDSDFRGASSRSSAFLDGCDLQNEGESLKEIEPLLRKCPSVEVKIWLLVLFLQSPKDQRDHIIESVDFIIDRLDAGENEILTGLQMIKRIPAKLCTEKVLTGLVGLIKFYALFARPDQRALILRLPPFELPELLETVPELLSNSSLNPGSLYSIFQARIAEKWAKASPESKNPSVLPYLQYISLDNLNEGVVKGVIKMVDASPKGQEGNLLDIMSVKTLFFEPKMVALAFESYAASNTLRFEDLPCFFRCINEGMTVEQSESIVSFFRDHPEQLPLSDYLFEATSKWKKDLILNAFAGSTDKLADWKKIAEEIKPLLGSSQ